MSSPMTAAEILDREFLELRAKILELAASMDRLDRATGSVSSDQRRAQLVEALQIVCGEPAGRAERVQSLFSLPYLADWRTQFKMDTLR